MTRNKWVIPVLITVILIAAVVIGIRYGSGKHKPDWTPEYKYGRSLEPFDVDVTRTLIRSAAGKDGFRTLPDTGRLASVLPDGTGIDYLFIGRNYNLSSDEARALYEFISRGNNVFIITEVLSGYSNDLFLDMKDEEGQNWLVYMMMETEYNDSFHLGPIGSFDQTLPVKWFPNMHEDFRVVKYIGKINYEYQIPPDELNVIQRINQDQPSFVSRKIGHGQVFIHTVPMVFTNVYMKNEEYFHHLNGLLSHMNGDLICWDNHARLKDGHIPPTMINRKHESEFSYLVSQPELRFVLYFSIFGMVLYVLFAMRRTQRPIPITDKNINMSLQSMRMISRLFYLYPNHKELINTKMIVFRHFVLSRYGVKSIEPNEDFYSRLSTVSGVRKEMVSSIFANYDRMMKKSRVSPEDAVYFTERVNLFYRWCK